jgi:hypothetical protein
MRSTLTVKEGLFCKLYGNITAIDCSCLRSKDCGGCFIYNSLQESLKDLEDNSNKIEISNNNSNPLVFSKQRKGLYLK